MSCGLATEHSPQTTLRGEAGRMVEAGCWAGGGEAEAAGHSWPPVQRP